MIPALLTRRPEPHDIPIMYALGTSEPLLRTNPDMPFLEADEFERYVLDYFTESLVAIEPGGTILGFVTASLSRHTTSRCFGNIGYLYVHPSWRRHGAGTSLLRGIMDRLKERGMTDVYTWARAGSPVIRLLGHLGFNAGANYTYMERGV